MPVRQLAFVVAIIGVAIVFGKSLSRGDDGASDDSVRSAAITVPGTDTAPATAPSAQRALGAFFVTDLAGSKVPLVTPGTPTILMVSSETCGWCKRALKDLGEMSGGRPLSRLTLLTLEGAASGAPMLAKERIAGARLVGPSGSTDQVLLTFRYPGTPTFVAIDRNGRVVKTMPGYPIREEMQHWFAVMVGDQDTP